MIKKYGLSRDVLYEKLTENGVFGRRYFYPLISDFPIYNSLKSAKRSNLPTAYEISKKVICLPMHTHLSENEVNRISDIIISFSK